MFKEEVEPKLTKQQKKEIKKVVDRYLRIRFKRRVRLLIGLKLK
jgi:hypothetical protein